MKNALSQVVSINDPASVTTRQKDVTETGFKVSLQAQASSSTHSPEMVSWIVVAPGTGEVEANVTTEDANHVPGVVQYATSHNTTAALLANMQTTNGTDTSNLRMLNVTATDFEVFVQEEESVYSSNEHADEVVGYLVVEPGLITN